MNSWLDRVLAPYFRGTRKVLQTEVLVEKRTEARLQLEEAIEALSQARKPRKAAENGH